MITPPKVPLSHPDRARECEDALREDNFALLSRGRAVRNEEFRELALRAKAAGWHGEEVGAAMVLLAEEYLRCAGGRQVHAQPRCPEQARP